MDEAARTGGSPVTEDERSPEEIRADIARTREEVGDTVEALAEKTDVKRQVQQQVDDIKNRLDRGRQELSTRAKRATPSGAQEGGQQVVTKVTENPAPLALAAALAVGYLLGRRRGRR